MKYFLAQFNDLAYCYEQEYYTAYEDACKAICKFFYYDLIQVHLFFNFEDHMRLLWQIDEFIMNKQYVKAAELIQKNNAYFIYTYTIKEVYMPNEIPETKYLDIDKCNLAKIIKEKVFK